MHPPPRARAQSTGSEEEEQQFQFTIPKFNTSTSIVDFWGNQAAARRLYDTLSDSFLVCDAVL
jgi:hypothetical protein